MEIWESIEFGAHAVLLKATVKKSREEIDKIGRNRLAKLVEHARGIRNSGGTSSVAWPTRTSN